ncbi:MAG: acetate--CoA ligase family protein [Cellulomonadaceae bacterium]|nr:acetate--CoA ligase family protein [Cellulomonadaceae bacterium]
MPIATGDYRHDAITGLFDPARIVVLGASAQRRASGNEAIGNLVRSGFAPEGIEVVHPQADVIDGLAVRRRIADLPPGPDVALVSLPSHALLGALRELEEIGTVAAVVPTAGLGPTMQHELAAFAAASGMAVHGNNCMGLLSIGGGPPLWFYDGGLGDLRPGGISLVSQSGSAVFLTRSVEHAGFARVVSTGNEIDLSTTDYMAWLAGDPRTQVVGLVLEQLRDEDAFTAAVTALRAAGKPVVALKVGRTAAGARATLAHTGALLSSSAAVEDYFRYLDVPLVSDYDQLAVTLELLALGVRPAGPRVAVVTDSGGEAALAADLAVSAGIPLPTFTERTTRRLLELVPVDAAHNPYDAGASPLTSDEEYDEAYAIVACDENVDAVMVVVEGHGAVTDSEARGVGEMLGSATRRALEGRKAVIAVSSSSTATHPLLPEVLGVPVVRGIVNGLVALRAAAANRAIMPPLPPARPAGLPSAAEVAVLRDRLVAGTSTTLGRSEAMELLGVYGIRPVSSCVTASADEAALWSMGRYPVVVKVASADVAHRSDIGAVEVGLHDEASLRRAYATILDNVALHRPDALVDGVEVQEQLSSSLEAIVGLTCDPVLGAAVAVGLGGVLVELWDAVASARVPVTPTGAEQLVAATPLGDLLGGYRGVHAPTSTGPLCDLVARLSWLGHDLRGVVHEIDLNPVMVEAGTGRTGVVDALITCAPRKEA